MRNVEVRSAAVWKCDECGEENFCKLQIAELTDQEAEEAYRRFNELEPWSQLPEHWRDFEMITTPSVVECQRCGEKFSTKQPRTEDE